MFCPKCATPNPDGGSFCRGCGANISLVPQALTGHLSNPQDEEVPERGRRRGRDRHGRDWYNRELTLDQAFKKMFLGIAFLIIAIALSRTGMGSTWWFWMLLPAFSLMGTGIAQFIRVKEKEKRAELQARGAGRAFANGFQREIPAPRTDELRPPVPSVTEGTTRHLGVEAPTRHLEPNEPK